MNYRYLLASIIAFLFLNLNVPCVAENSPDIVKVNPALQYQTWDGWGTSLSWWANVIGGWSEQNRSDIADLIFDKEKGLGLTIARYNIGGQDDPSHDHMRVGGDIPSFKMSEDGLYDWTADANQRWMLQAAIKRGVDITEAFACTPPFWMTVSGCTAGAVDAKDNNLRDEYYETFADYLTDVVKQFRDQWGVSFTTLEPMNEPSTDFWKAQGFHQGCHYDHDKQNTLLRLVAAKLKEKGLNTKLSGADESFIDHAVTTFLAYDDDVKDLVSQINTHTYSHWGDREKLRNIAKEHNKKLYMSEICFASRQEGEEHDHQTMKGPLDMAWGIILELRGLRPDAWVFWQPCINETYCNWWKFNYGLIHADYMDGTEKYDITKKYYGYAHFSKFIRPGFRMIDIGVENAVAFVDGKNDALVIVTYNLGEKSRTRTYDLSAFNSVKKKVKVYRTTKNLDLAVLPGVKLKKKRLVIEEPGPSVNTYVISGAVYKGPLKEDIKSPDDSKEGNRNEG